MRTPGAPEAPGIAVSQSGRIYGQCGVTECGAESPQQGIFLCGEKVMQLMVEKAEIKLEKGASRLFYLSLEYKWDRKCLSPSLSLLTKKGN